MQRVDTEDKIKSYYGEKNVVAKYELNRYGNINKSLSHWIDCDAIEYFLRKYTAASNGKYLDLACGTGRLTRALAAKGLDITSADYSEEMLETATQKSRLEKIPFHPVRMDALHLTFDGETFNGVFTIRFIRHYTPEKRALIYQQIRRVLKPGGILVFDVLNAAVDTTALERKVYDETYTWEEFQKEMADNGFVVRERIAGNIVGIPVYTIAKKWSLLRLGRSLAKHYRRREDIINRATHWMVACEKSA
jgi:ubiquinone/menaquinone biosynthesis C-methylase UbiE